MKYIAYGSNMSVTQMEYRSPNAKLIGIGRIDHARLEFYLHATVEHTQLEADIVPVAVWEINADDEFRLDLYEGFPGYYTKKEWTAHMVDGSEIKGMIYLMKRIHPQPPMRSYYEGIRSAYEGLGLTSEIGTVLEPALARAIERTR